MLRVENTSGLYIDNRFIEFITEKVINSNYLYDLVSNEFITKEKVIKKINLMKEEFFFEAAEKMTISVDGFDKQNLFFKFNKIFVIEQNESKFNHDFTKDYIDFIKKELSSDKFSDFYFNFFNVEDKIKEMNNLQSLTKGDKVLIELIFTFYSDKNIEKDYKEYLLKHKE